MYTVALYLNSVNVDLIFKMNQLHAIQALREFDNLGRFVFSRHDLTKLFPNDSTKTLEIGLGRLVKAGILIRACKGVYVNDFAQSKDGYIIEHIAKILRRGAYNYVSLESMLSEYGAISQIPIDRLTVMTTGRTGVYTTPYGVIEFTHTKRTIITILDGVERIPGRPLRVASKKTAIRDLKRVGRNLNLLLEGDENANDEMYRFIALSKQERALKKITFLDILLQEINILLLAFQIALNDTQT
jgi:hypothetical protein